MFIDSTGLLEVNLAEAATTQLPYVACSRTTNAAGQTSAPVQTNGTTNSTTPVTCLAAPAAGNIVSMVSFSCYNADNLAHNIFVQLNVSGTRTIRVEQTVPAKSSLMYSTKRGWYVFPVVPAIFIASGPLHAAGAVPDPGSTAGKMRSLNEDGTWKLIPFTYANGTFR